MFVIFTICSLAEQLGRSTVSVSSALKELDAAGLIERRRTRFSSPNHIFVKIPNVE
ncbi:winged helix-turn-helix domain-containing protein [Faecalibacterium sp. I3-3-33]|nr:winged helix-turn-helix domain-containing protein [Faecalibacterium prausnitzii]MDE8723895.1 winged helix-turn-helix domain-containing protein [Faecalibacterium prausnitzii]UQK47041.1 winged helix-turn-helix domain-containing protein [Faecalibacterium sp. I3-3-33]